MAVLLFGGLILSYPSRAAVLFLILILGAWEYARMVNVKFPTASAYKGALFCASLTFLFLLPHWPSLAFLDTATWTWGITLIAISSLILWGFRSQRIESMAPWIIMQCAGVIYFGVWGAKTFDLFLPKLGWAGIYPLLMIEFCMAMADVGAYFSGKTFGKHKLAPSISPKKTIEGAVGGTLLTLLLTLWLAPIFLSFNIWQSVGLGLLMSFTDILGDLIISSLKRYTGTKDSSQLIPGHGGVLDRFDSLLFSAPFAVYYIQLIHGH